MPTGVYDRTKKDPVERYWAKVDKTTYHYGWSAECVATGELLGKCWAWTAYKTEWGHGTFKLNGKVVSAHQFAWSLEHGEMPSKGLVIHHRCGNPGCQNVAHMEVMTPSEHTTLHHLIDPTRRNKSTHCRRCEVELTEENKYASATGSCKKCHKAESAECYQKRKAKKLKGEK